jgi:hypothetical protein
MAIMYENQRVQFNRILKKYQEYLRLYQFINHGSTTGAAGFAEFYWRQTYFSRYRDGIHPMERGY